MALRGSLHPRPHPHPHIHPHPTLTLTPTLIITITITQIKWLSEEDPQFLTEVVLAFKPEVFTPNESAFMPPALHVVHSGRAVYGGRILRKGDVWGDDVLVCARHLRARIHARAIGFVEAFYITRDVIFGAANTSIRLSPYLQPHPQPGPDLDLDPNCNPHAHPHPRPRRCPRHALTLTLNLTLTQVWLPPISTPCSAFCG